MLQKHALFPLRDNVVRGCVELAKRICRVMPCFFTTEHTDHTELLYFPFRVFSVFRLLFLLSR
jgi:hypothetical protein